MKVLLVYPRFEPYSSPPLGVAYLASYLKSFGIDVDILDCTFVTREYARKKILFGNWDIVGISVVTSTMNESIDLTKQLKDLKNPPLLVFGGAHATAVPEDTLKYCDVVCVGEAEKSFHELCEAYKNKQSFKDIKGIYFKDKDKVVFTGLSDFIEDLDSVPFPDRELLDMDSYFNNKIGRQRWCIPQPSTSMIATRGCPFNCTYCATKYIHGKKIRYRSVKNVIDEIKFLKDTYSIKSIYFNDDTFTANLSWLTELCRELKKLNIKWSTNTRVDLVDEHKIKMMKDAGCSFLSLGIESGSEKILSQILKKGTNLNKIIKAFNLTSKYGIMTQGTCMLGIPGETKEDIKKTIKFVKKIDADSIQFTIFTPFPGTEIFDYVQENGKFLFDSWKDFTYYEKPVFEMPELKISEIKSSIKKAYMGFYLRPSYFFKQIYKMRNYDYFIQMRNGVYNLFSKLVFKR